MVIGWDKNRSPDVVTRRSLKELGQIYREIFGASSGDGANPGRRRLVETAARLEIGATAVVSR
jgi:hypothetical protein